VQSASSERFKDIPEREIKPDKKDPGCFGHAAGGGRRKGDPTNYRERPSKKIGYAWGDVDRQQGTKAAYEGAAGVGSKQLQSVAECSKRIVADKNFHIGLTNNTTDQAVGVYDFHPSSQGQRARSAPKRRTQVGELINGRNLPCQQAAPDQFEDAYKGAAGMSAGHWADARYASTTNWN